MASNAEVKRALEAAPIRTGLKRVIAKLSDWARFETGVMVPKYARPFEKLHKAVDLSEDTTTKLLAEAERTGWWHPTPDPKRPDRLLGEVTIPEDIALLVKLGRVPICQYEACGKVLTGRAGARFCGQTHRQAAHRLDIIRDKARTSSVTEADPDLDIIRDKGETDPDIIRDTVTLVSVTEADIIRDKAQVTGTSTSSAVGQSSVEDGLTGGGSQRSEKSHRGSNTSLRIPKADDLAAASRNEHCNCPGPYNDIAADGLCDRCGYQGSRFKSGGYFGTRYPPDVRREGPPCDHRFKGQPPHYCIHCGAAAIKTDNYAEELGTWQPTWPSRTTPGEMS